MKILGRKNTSKKILVKGTICPICRMNFLTTLRMMKHMKKAHGKIKRDYPPRHCPNC